MKKSIEVMPYHKTYDKLGLVYAELNMEEKAIESFKEAIKINPRYAKAHNDLAAVYGRIGEFDLALQEFNEAIRIDRDYADAYYNLAVIYEFLKDTKKAENLLVKALEIEPNNNKVRNKLTNLKSK